MKIGELSVTVEVRAAAVNVDTETSALRGAIGTRQVSELPLSGRDVTKLVLLVPGTVDAPVGTYQQAFSFPGRSAIPSNGGWGNMVNFTLDGSNANDNYTNVNNPMPNPDVIQEITVQTASFSARYGQSGSAAVNAGTRSGANQVHGSGFEYLRNNALNAKDLFSQKTDGLKRNQFGFSLGGPVYIPGVYKGRNRTFFFNSYQGTHTRTTSSSSLVILPTAEQRNGDFSALTRQLVDPDTNAPFPSNRIPASQIGSFASKLLNYLPTPGPLAGFAPGSMFVFFPNQENLWEYLAKIDHQTGTRNQVSGRYFITNYAQPSFFDGSNLVTARGGKLSRYQSASVHDTFTFRPNLVNQFLYSYEPYLPFHDKFHRGTLFVPGQQSQVFPKTTPIPRPVSLSARNPSRRSSYIQNWNLTLEREVVANLLARVSYVGSKGTRLETSYEGNPPLFTPGRSTTSNINDRRIYAAAGLGAINVGSTEGLSVYHGVQGAVEHRFRSGLAWQASYTFSKAIDNLSIANGTSPLFDNPFNKNAYRAISDFDVTHRFVTAYVWNIPTYKAQSRFARFLIGAWSTSSVLAAQTGLPFTVRPGQDRSLTGINLDHADLVGNPRIANPGMSTWFDKSAFALPTLGSFGNAGRNILHVPGFWNIDWSAAKEFLFSENWKLQFRTELFNALNHTNPSAPTATLTSPNFARILGYRGPRVLQMSLRLNF